MKKITSYRQALTYLYSYIPNEKQYSFPGDFGLRRAKHLLHLANDPQNKLKVIHIAGTSGKGSTAFFISCLLKVLGFKVGLHISPHLLDLRERYQINNKLLPYGKFFHYLNEFIPFIEQMRSSEFGQPTYFEISVALAYFIFHKEKVDYAIIETALGGLYDGTNVVDREDKIAVITQIGHDHTEILGKTIAKIAFQKAGIIHHKNTVVTIKQQPRAMRVIEKVAIEKKAQLEVVGNKSVSHARLLPRPRFDFQFHDVRLFDVKLNMLGSHQIQNASLALAVVILLSKRDTFIFDQEKIRTALTNATLPGRMDILKMSNKTVVLDGAHNPQKMKTFITNLIQHVPCEKFDFLIAFKKGKDIRKMLRIIIPYARKITISTFNGNNRTLDQGYKILSEEPENISRVLKQLTFKNYKIIANDQEAFQNLLVTGNSVKVVTGSLYLMSEIYSFIRRSK